MIGQSSAINIRALLLRELRINIMENPYAYLSHPFDPQNFFGSKEWIETILRRVSSYSPISMEFRGLRTMGKSFLTKYLADPEGALSQNHDLLLEPYNSKPEMLLMILIEYRKIPPNTHAFTYLYQRFKEFIHSQTSLRQYSTGLPEDAEISPTIAVEACGNMIRKLATDGYRIVLILDDFDRVFKDLQNDETTMLRPWVDHTSFIIMTEHGLETVNPSAVGSVFFSILDMEYVGGVSRQEADKIIDHAFAVSGISFPQNDRAFLHEHAGKHPYLMIRACQELWDYRKKRNLLESDKPLTGRDITIFHNKLKAKFERVFLGYINTLTPEELFALKTVLQEREGDSEEPTALPILEDLGLIEYDSENQEYNFFSPLFKEFLEKQNVEQFIIKTEQDEKEKTSKRLTFSQREQKLYKFLRESEGQVCTFGNIAEEVFEIDPADWQDEKKQPQISHNIRVYITRLRKKLDENENIINIHGTGYVYEQQE
jgi:DNA-binding response OmpR family regulator